MLTALLSFLLACTGSGGVTPGLPDTAGPGPSEELPLVEVTPDPLVPGEVAHLLYRGARDRDSLLLAYGWNGWNAVDAPNLLEHGGRGDVTVAGLLKLRPTTEGFAGDLPVPLDARALHFAFYAPEAEPPAPPPDTGAGEETDWPGFELVDDNGGREYHRSVVFPYIGPYLQWTPELPPGEGVLVSFETDEPGWVAVDYGPSPDELDLRAESTDDDTVHHVPLRDLEPGTWYYRVRDERHVSDTWSFTLQSPDETDFRFALLSDAQDDGEGERWADVAAALPRDLAFALVVGDLAANDEPGHWWTFFDRGRDFLASVPVVATAGNHDTPSTQSDEDLSDFRRYFPGTDEDAPALRFDFGGAAFLSLDSELRADFAEGGAQYRWVEEQLSEMASSDEPPAWVFLDWHVPPYNAGGRHQREQLDLRPLTSLLDGRVDWVFCGHEHLYQRFQPLRWEAEPAPSGEYGRGPDDGVGYLVLPPAGRHPSDRLAPEEQEGGELRALLAYPPVYPELQAAPSELGYVLVELSWNTFSLEAWGLGSQEAPLEPHVVDRVTYTR